MIIAWSASLSIILVGIVIIQAIHISRLTARNDNLQTLNTLMRANVNSKDKELLKYYQEYIRVPEDTPTGTPHSDWHLRQKQATLLLRKAIDNHKEIAREKEALATYLLGKKLAEDNSNPNPKGNPE